MRFCADGIGMIAHNDFTNSVKLSPLEPTDANNSILHGEMRRDDGIFVKVIAVKCWRLEADADYSRHGDLYDLVSR